MVLSEACVKMHPLKIKLEFRDSSSLSLVLKLAFYSLLSSRAANSSNPRNRVLSVYILITLKVSFSVVINRHGSYVDMVMDSFSLWCLWYVAYQWVPALGIPYNGFHTIMTVSGGY
jgi:hypothetical protein